MANDLLAFGEWFIIFRPFSNERSVVQPLVWPEFIVKADIRSNEMIEVLLAKDDEEIQALEFKGFPPSLNKCILIWRLRCRLLDSETDVFEHLIEFSNVHADDSKDCEKSDKGFIEKITSNINIRGDFDDAQRKRLAQIVERCPVHKTLGRGLAFEDNATFN